ncbi:MAG: T9SS type A sorting domain-containing protein [Bacteroidota bacterium]
MRVSVWLIAILLSVGPLTSFAQCVPDTTLQGTLEISPDSLVDAVGCQYYEEVLSFVLPRDTTAVIGGIPFTANFEYYTIDSVFNLPQGMEWECNLAPDCRYIVSYDSANVDTLGCVTIFGTPEIPTTYNVTVALTAVFSAFNQQDSAPATFSLPLTVNPCAFIGDCYSLELDDNCAPAILTAVNNIPSGGQSGFSYQWSITGPNGYALNTTDEVLNPQIFSDPGTYFVNYQADIDTIGYILNGLTIDSVLCADIIDGGDLYWILKDPSGTELINTSANPISNGGDNLPINTNIAGLALVNGTYELQVWDSDAIGNDDGCATGSGGSGASIFFSIPSAQTGTFSQTNGGLKVTFTIDNPRSIINCTDTVIIDPVPMEPTIVANGTDPVVGSYAWCTSQPLTLTVTNGDSVQWFLDGDPIMGQGNTLEVTSGGAYEVLVVDLNTFCISPMNAFFMDENTTPLPVILENPDELSVQNPSGNLNYNWIDASGTVVASGPTFNPESSGDYRVVAVDASGCPSDTTAATKIILTNIDRWDIVAQSFNLFPNPSQGLMHLKGFLPTTSQVDIRLMDMLGRTVFQTQREVSQQFDVEIQVPEQLKGVFILLADTPYGPWQQKVVIK